LPFPSRAHLRPARRSSGFGAAPWIPRQASTARRRFFARPGLPLHSGSTSPPSVTRAATAGGRRRDLSSGLPSFDPDAHRASSGRDSHGAGSFRELCAFRASVATAPDGSRPSARSLRAVRRCASLSVRWGGGDRAPPAPPGPTQPPDLSGVVTSDPRRDEARETVGHPGLRVRRRPPSGVKRGPLPHRAATSPPRSQASAPPGRRIAASRFSIRMDKFETL
jgi:hypothetical protein